MRTPLYRAVVALLAVCALLLSGCGKTPAGDSPSETTETQQPSAPAASLSTGTAANQLNTGLMDAMATVYREKNNITAKVFAYETGDGAYLFAVNPPEALTPWDFKPISLYFYHAFSNSVHFLGEFNILALRVVNGAKLAMLTTDKADIIQGGTYAFPKLQFLTLERAGTAQMPAFSAKLEEEPFYAAVQETSFYADAPFGERNLLAVQDAFDGVALLADFDAFDKGRLHDYGRTPALQARLSFEQDGRVLTVRLPDVVESKVADGDLGIHNAFIESAALQNSALGGKELVLRLTPYAKYYALRAEAVFAPGQPRGTWMDTDPATGKRPCMR